MTILELLDKLEAGIQALQSKTGSLPVKVPRKSLSRRKGLARKSKKPRKSAAARRKPGPTVSPKGEQISLIALEETSANPIRSAHVVAGQESPQAFGKRQALGRSLLQLRKFSQIVTHPDASDGKNEALKRKP